MIFVGEQEVASYANIMSLTGKEFEEWIDQYQQVRQLLKFMTARERNRTEYRKAES